MAKKAYKSGLSGASASEVGQAEQSLRKKYPVMWDMIQKSKWGKKLKKTRRTKQVEKQMSK